METLKAAAPGVMATSKAVAAAFVERLAQRQPSQPRNIILGALGGLRREQLLFSPLGD
jgi:hypothetical protein